MNVNVVNFFVHSLTLFVFMSTLATTFHIELQFLIFHKYIVYRKKDADKTTLKDLNSPHFSFHKFN